MSAQAFIPELWAKKMLKELDKEHMLVKNCSTDYSGEISGQGSRVKINSVNSPTVTAFTGALSAPEEIKDEQRMLEITEAQSFHFYLDDIDAKQSTGGILEEAMRKAAIAIKDKAEAFIASKFSEGENTITQSALTTGNFFSTFMRAKRFLMRANVGMADDCIAEVTPEVWEKGVLANILYNQDNSDIISKGQYVKSLGMTFYVSNNIPVTVTSEFIVAQTCAVRTKEAIGYAEQIMKVEKYRPELGFRDAVKGLHVYGAKTIKPKEMVSLVLTTAAETTI